MLEHYGVISYNVKIPPVSSGPSDGINIISLVTKQNGDGTAEVTIRAALNNNGMDIIEQIREAGYEVSDVMTLDGIE